MINRTKAIIMGVAATATMGGAIANDQLVYLDALGYGVITKTEYQELKTNIADKASKDAFSQYHEIELYVALLDKEQKKCGGRLYPITCKQDIRDMLKKFNKGCPEIIK